MQRLILALLLAAVCTTAQATLSVADFLKPPAFSSPTLSRDGRYVAVRIPVNGRLNLAVLDLETRQASALTNFSDYDVENVNWIGSSHLVFSLGQNDAPSGPGGADSGGLFVVSRDGKQSRRLSATARDQFKSGAGVLRTYQYLRSVPGSEDDIIATGNLREANSLDLYRINVRSGRAELLTPTRPARTFAWLLDPELVPRVATSRIQDSNTLLVHYRASADAPFREIARVNNGAGQTFVPLAIENDGRTLRVATNQGRDTMAVFRFDPETLQLGELLAQHPRYDMGADATGARVPGAIVDPESQQIAGYAVDAERLERVWLDPASARTQQLIDAALPSTLNRFSRTPAGTRVIVSASSDVQPTRWYLLDEDKKTLEELFASRPWMKPEQLTEMKPFLLKTRDGLEIPSYYFLPRQRREGEKLPLVMHIHGGPHVRADRWGQFSFGVIEAQLLAARGYAVVLPNFRITPGLGAKVYYSGFGTYGRQMVDDHIDAAQWMIDQGFADPARICVSGASYGGAGGLLALARAPQMFKCGVIGLIVSDMRLQLTSTAGDTAYNPAGVRHWLRLLGAKDIDSIPPEASPLNLVANIQQPLLIYAGADDIRTPIEQTRKMISALEAAGNPPKKVIIKAGEGHGFGIQANRIELYDEMLKFLDQQIGPASLQH